jgi:hypothetical protein
MIALESDGSYQMLQLATDCSSRFFSNGGTRYQKNGQMLGSIEADHQPSPLTSSDLSKAALEACQAAKERWAFNGAFSAPKALTALFGNYDGKSKSSSVTVQRAELSETDGTAGASAGGKLTVMLDSPFTKGGAAKHLLVTTTTVEGEEGHPYQARIGAFLFANRTGRWIPEIVDKEALRSGEYGTAGEAQAVRFAPGVYGFSLTDSSCRGECAGEEFVAPVGNHYRSVLAVTTLENDLDHCDRPDAPWGRIACYEKKQTVRFLESAHGFFDIETTETGTELNEQRSVVPVNRKRIFVFSGEKYVEQPAAQPLTRDPIGGSGR